MKEQSLDHAKVGSVYKISRCLAPARSDVYRLLELGLCEGSSIKILAYFPLLKAMVIAVTESRLCIAEELARQFLALRVE